MLANQALTQRYLRPMGQNLSKAQEELVFPVEKAPVAFIGMDIIRAGTTCSRTPWACLSTTRVGLLSEGRLPPSGKTTFEWGSGKLHTDLLHGNSSVSFQRAQGSTRGKKTTAVDKMKPIPPVPARGGFARTLRNHKSRIQVATFNRQPQTWLVPHSYGGSCPPKSCVQPN